MNSVRGLLAGTRDCPIVQSPQYLAALLPEIVGFPWAVAPEPDCDQVSSGLRLARSLG